MRATLIASRLGSAGGKEIVARQLSKSFVRAVMDQLYIQTCDSTGWPIPNKAITWRPGQRTALGHIADAATMTICGRGTGGGGLNMTAESSTYSPAILDCLGIVVGGDDTAVVSGDFRLRDLLQSPGPGAAETWCVLPAPAVSSPLAWDATLGCFWTMNANLTPWELYRWTTAGVLAETRTVVGTAATASTQYDLKADATYVYILGGASSRYVYKVAKADGTNINVNAYTLLSSGTPYGMALSGAFLYVAGTARAIKLNIADLSTAAGPWLVTGFPSSNGGLHVFDGKLLSARHGRSSILATLADPPVFNANAETFPFIYDTSNSSMYGFAVQDDETFWSLISCTYPTPARLTIFRHKWPASTNTIMSSGTLAKVGTIDAAHGEIDIFCDFYNAGTGDQTIKEVGIYSLQPPDGLCCIARDVLGAPVVLAAGETLRVEYLVECFV